MKISDGIKFGIGFILAPFIIIGGIILFLNIFGVFGSYMWYIGFFILGIIILFGISKSYDKRMDERRKEKKEFKKNPKYFCAECKTPVKEDVVRCPKCKSILGREGGIILKKK